MPFLAVSPWQVIFVKPLYFGFFHYGLLMALIIIQVYEDIKNKSLSVHPVFGLFGAFVITAGLSLLLNWHSIDGITLENAIGFKAPHIYNVFTLIYLIFNILTIWVVSKIISSKEKLNNSIEIIATSAVAASLCGIIMLFAVLAGILPDCILVNATRLQGTATEPQVFGNFLLLGLPLIIIKFISNPTLLNTVFLFIAFLAFIMTFSLGAWIGMFFALVFLSWQILKNLKLVHFKNIAGVLIVAALFLAICKLMNPHYFEELRFKKLYFWQLKEDIKYHETTKQYPRNDDKLERFWLAKTAINQFLYRPLIGVGFGNYGFLYNQFIPKDADTKPYIAKPHNSYLEVLAETGIVGFILFISPILIIFFNALKATFAIKKNNIINLTIIGAFIGLATQGFFFGIFVHNYTWIAIGLLFAIGIYNNNKEKYETKK